MNYNDEILENKTFNFFKKLMYNIAVAICIVLLFTLILVFGFKFRLYNVLSNSQYPIFKKGDMVVVKPEENIKVGDIIKFDDSGIPITHRLIYILNESGQTYYICHGDAVQSIQGAENDTWQANRAVLEGKSLSEIRALGGNLIQVLKYEQIEGKVIGWLSNYGTYVDYIQKHTLVVVAALLGIWCVSATYQNEAEIKRMGRLA